MELRWIGKSGQELDSSSSRRLRNCQIYLVIHTIYAEVNQVTSAKASKSAAISDWAVVIIDMFVAGGFAGQYCPFASFLMRYKAKSKHTLNEYQNAHQKNDAQSSPETHAYLRVITTTMIRPRRCKERRLLWWSIFSSCFYLCHFRKYGFIQIFLRISMEKKAQFFILYSPLSTRRLGEWRMLHF